VAALLSLLINKHGQKKRDRSLYKCRAYPSGSNKHWNQKRQKWERKKLQLSQETFKLLFYSGSEDQRRHFCRTCKRTENRWTYCYRLRCRLRNDDNNRPSLISGSAADERQEVSSKKHDRWVVWCYHWRQRYRSLVIQYSLPEKMREYWLKNEKLFLKHDVP